MSQDHLTKRDELTSSTRICPGQHLADASLFIVMASMLATLNISKPVDLDGKELTPAVELSEGLVSSVIKNHWTL